MLREFERTNKAREKHSRAEKRAVKELDFAGIGSPEWARDLKQRIESYRSPSVSTSSSECSDEEAEKKVPEHGRQEITEAPICTDSHVFWGAYLKCPRGDCPIADENVFCSVYPDVNFREEHMDAHFRTTLDGQWKAVPGRWPSSWPHRVRPPGVDVAPAHPWHAGATVASHNVEYQRDRLRSHFRCRQRFPEVFAEWDARLAAGLPRFPRGTTPPRQDAVSEEGEVFENTFRQP